MRKRGTLNASGVVSGTPNEEEEDFNYDATGNWTDYLTKVSGSTTLDQQRTHNRANEVLTIEGSSATVGYDAAGNMTTMPK